MLVAFVLSYEVESVLVEIQTHEGLHCQYEISQIEGMLDSLTVKSLYF